MEELFLRAQVRNFRINGNDRFGKLVHGGESVQEPVVPDDDLLTGAGFEPAVAVTAEQNCGAVGMIEEVVFADDPFRRAEQCSARPVVANGIIPEFHFVMLRLLEARGMR